MAKLPVGRLAFVTFLLLTLLSATTFAQNGGNGGNRTGGAGGGRGGGGRRTVTMNVKSRSVEFKTYNPRQTGGLTYVFSTNGLPSLRAGFLTNYNGSQISVTFRTSLLSLVEFNADTPVASSTKIFRFAGSTNDWSNMVGVQTDVNSTTLYNATSQMTSTRTGFQGLRVTMNVFVATGNVRNGMVINTNATKFSLKVENFPYTVTNSKLAIVLGVASKSNSRSKNGNMVQLESGLAAFNWDPTVYADGAVADISVGNLEDDDGQNTDSNDDNKRDDETVNKITYSVMATQPKVVFWDPSLSLDESTIQAAMLAASTSDASGLAILYDMRLVITLLVAVAINFWM